MSQSTLIKTILRLSSAVLALTTILVFSLESMALNLLFLLLIFWTLALSAFTAYKLSRRVFWLWPLLGVGLGFVLVNVLMARVEDRFWARFVYDETLGWKPTAGLHREPFEISGG